MKHLSLSCLSLLASVSLWAQSSTIDINGTPYPVDTTMQYQAGPGVWHTRFTVNKNGTKHNLYLLEVDLANPYNTVEEYQSQSEMGKTETMASAYRVLDAENHRTIGGVNCNFWIVPANINGDKLLDGCLGQPFSATARNGVLVGNPDGWMWGAAGMVMIDENKQVQIDHMAFDGVVTVGEQRHAIREVNRSRVTPNADEISLFNHYLGKTPTRATSGIEVVFSINDWKINSDLACEVVDINTAGGTVIAEGMGALQGLGEGQTFLSQLKKGDKFTLNLGVFSTNQPDYRPDIRQMVTGNGLLMKNGVLTDRNTNDGYNNQNYPRTLMATDDTHNRFYMLVAEKPGMFTADMCGILKNCGATFAAGLDGGGSAQMCLDGAVINPTTEGVPRAVANSFWVFSTAPDDDYATRIAPLTPTLVLPKYGAFMPQFYCYNQYDVLLSKGFTDVQLSCDETTGYITEDGKFICLGDGVLHASYQGATVDMQVKAVTDAKFFIRLDSVLVSDDTDYAIQVQAVAEGNLADLTPDVLKWTVADPAVCTVSDKGVLNGLHNGSTWVYAEMGGNTDSILVYVEIPENKPLLWNNMAEAETLWDVDISSSWKPVFSVNDQNQTLLTFNYSIGRKASIKFTMNTPLYSLPRYMELRFNPGDVVFERVITALSANNGVQSFVQNDTAFVLNETNHVIIDIQKLLSSDDIAIYPVQLNYINMMVNKANGVMQNREYTVTFDGIYLHYGEISVGFDGITAPSFMVYPNPAENILNIMGLPDSPVEARLYDLQGHLLLQTVLQGNGQINVEQLSQGNYLLKIGTETLKLIRK